MKKILMVISGATLCVFAANAVSKSTSFATGVATNVVKVADFAKGAALNNPATSSAWAVYDGSKTFAVVTGQKALALVKDLKKLSPSGTASGLAGFTFDTATDALILRGNLVNTLFDNSVGNYKKLGLSQNCPILYTFKFTDKLEKAVVGSYTASNVSTVSFAKGEVSDALATLKSITSGNPVLAVGAGAKKVAFDNPVAFVKGIPTQVFQFWGAVTK